MQKIKNLFKISLLGLFVLVTSCETQEIITKESSTNKIETKKVSFKSLFSIVDGKTNSCKSRSLLLNTKSPSNLSARGENDFIKYIDTTVVEYISIDGKFSYTLRIITEDDALNKFYNMVLYEKYGVFYAKYIKYQVDPTKAEEEKLLTAIKTSVDENGLEVAAAQPESGTTQRDNCSAFAPVWQCSNGNAHGPDDAHTPACSATSFTIIAWQEYNIPCTGDSQSNDTENNPNPSDNITTPSSNPSVGGGSGTGYSTSTNTTGGVYGNGTIYTIPVQPIKTLKQIKLAFQATLNATQLAWWNNPVNATSVAQIVTYLTNNQVHDLDDNPEQFAKEIIDLAATEQIQTDVNSLINMTLIINNNEDNLFEDSFALTLDPFVDLDLVNPPDITPNLLGVEIFFDCP